MKQHGIHSQKERSSGKQSAYKLIICLILAVALLTPSLSSAQEGTKGKVLILYSSLTGNTKACCEALQKELQADIIEIKDVIDRSGKWGFFKTAIGSLFGSHTKIEPENPDISSYASIIIGSPIWTGKLSMATRTLIDKNSFAGKKVIIFTTTNAFEKEKYKEKSKDLVRKAGGDVVGYYQVVAKEEVDGEKVDRGIERMLEDTLTFVPEIKEAFSLTE
jgi:flavodoxin